MKSSGLSNSMLGKLIAKHPSIKINQASRQKKASTAPKQGSRGYQPTNGVLCEASLIARSLFINLSGGCVKPNNGMGLCARPHENPAPCSKSIPLYPFPMGNRFGPHLSNLKYFTSHHRHCHTNSSLFNNPGNLFNRINQPGCLWVKVFGKSIRRLAVTPQAFAFELRQAYP